MDATYDIALGQLTIQRGDLGPHWSWLNARLIYPPPMPRVQFADLSFGATVTVNDSVAAETVQPPPGVRLVSSDQTLLHKMLVRWQPDDAVTVEAWIRNAGVDHTATDSFTVPRPPQPYASWTWDSEARRWVAPVPMPDDGGMYAWDEVAGEWVSG